MALVTDEKDMPVQRQVPPDMTGQRIPRGIDDIDHHMSFRVITPAGPIQPRPPFFRSHMMPQCGLPLTCKRNCRHDYSNHKIREKAAHTFNCSNRQNCFPRSCYDMRNPSPMACLPFPKTIFLPFIQILFHHSLPANSRFFRFTPSPVVFR